MVPPKGSSRLPRTTAPGGISPLVSLGVWREALGSKGFLMEGGERSLPPMVSLCPSRKKSPFSLKLVPVRHSFCPEGVQIPLVDGTNGVKGGVSPLSISVVYSAGRRTHPSLRVTPKSALGVKVWVGFVMVLEGVSSFSRTVKDSLYLPWGALSQG
jgi:hypothetical protein